MRERPIPMYRQYLRRGAGKVRHLSREILIASRMARGRGSMPSFIIVGAQKVATTSLYDALVRDPDVSPAYLKEIHYFDAFYDKGPAWYRAHFPDNEKRTVSGEASPSYLLHPLAARRIREIVGPILIIVMLRDPVERAISHYWHEVGHGYEQRPPDVALLGDEGGVAERLRKLEVTGRGWGSYLMRRSYKTRGVYLPQIRRYFEAFGPDSVKLVGFREFARNPRSVTGDIRERLGLRAETLEHLPVHHNRRRVNHPIPETVRRKLERYFAGPNEELRAYLGTLPDW